MAGCGLLREAGGHWFSFRLSRSNRGLRGSKIENRALGTGGRGLARPDSGNLSAEDWAITREIVEAVKRAIPDASSQPPGAVLQYAKNVAGLVLAVLTIVSPFLDHTSARSRRKPAEKAWRIPTGRPFKLPDWPGFHWVGLLTSVMFDTCFHLIIFTLAGTRARSDVSGWRTSSARQLGASQARLHVPAIQEAARQRRGRHLLVCAQRADESAAPRACDRPGTGRGFRQGPRRVLNVWREDLSDFIPFDVIESATDWGVHERGPQAGVSYVAYCDASSGVADSFAIAVASRGPPHMLHVVRERKPRFVPAQVIAEYAELLKLYGITEVQSDKYAIGFHEAEWNRHGIKLTACRRTTSENYLHALPLLLAGRVRLVDSVTLRSQLASLERRVGAGDRETVSHPSHASAHDDVACAACGAITVAAKPGYSVHSGWLDLPAAAETAGGAHFVDLAVAPHVGPPIPAQWRSPYWR